MDKYRRVKKERNDESAENEVRITQKGKVKNSIAYVTSLFEVGTVK